MIQLKEFLFTLRDLNCGFFALPPNSKRTKTTYKHVNNIFNKSVSQRNSAVGEDATEFIEELFRSDYWYYGIALSTRVAVVDIDVPKESIDIEQHIQEKISIVLDSVYNTADPVIVRTKSGGAHIYFELEDTVQDSDKTRLSNGHREKWGGDLRVGLPKRDTSRRVLRDDDGDLIESYSVYVVGPAYEGFVQEHPWHYIWKGSEVFRLQTNVAQDLLNDKTSKKTEESLEDDGGEIGEAQRNQFSFQISSAAGREYQHAVGLKEALFEFLRSRTQGGSERFTDDELSQCIENGLKDKPKPNEDPRFHRYISKVPYNTSNIMEAYASVFKELPFQARRSVLNRMQFIYSTDFGQTFGNPKASDEVYMLMMLQTFFGMGIYSPLRTDKKHMLRTPALMKCPSSALFIELFKAYSEEQPVYDEFRLWLEELRDTNHYKLDLDKYWSKFETFLGNELFNITDEQPYHRNFLPAVLTGLVERTFNPGAKNDMMFGLIGDQGCGKSTFCEHLLPERFRSLIVEEEFPRRGASESRIRDFKARCADHKVVVLNEFSASASEANRLKAFISETVDVFRRPYERKDEIHPRSFIMLFTLNGDEVMPQDVTGNRRIFPIEVERKIPISNNINISNRDHVIKKLEQWRTWLFTLAVKYYDTHGHAFRMSDSDITDWSRVSEEEYSTKNENHAHELITFFESYGKTKMDFYCVTTWDFAGQVYSDLNITPGKLQRAALQLGWKFFKIKSTRYERASMLMKELRPKAVVRKKLNSRISIAAPKEYAEPLEKLLKPGRGNLINKSLVKDYLDTILNLDKP